MHFVIVVPHSKRDPNKGPISAEHLRHVGLEDLIPGCTGTAIAPGQGFPGGEGGIRFHWDRDERSITGDPTALTWVPAESRGSLAAERYWVGYKPDDPPTATELRRRECPLALFVTSQWQEWALPAAAKIPADWVMVRGGGGKLTRDIPARWKEFWDRACDWQRTLALTALEDEGHTDHMQRLLDQRGEQWWEFHHFVFNIAYRMPAELLFALRILNTENRTIPVLLATGGLMTDEIANAVQEAVEKKAALLTGTGANMSPGETASIESTGPTSLISA